MLRVALPDGEAGGGGWVGQRRERHGVDGQEHMHEGLRSAVSSGRQVWSAAGAGWAAAGVALSPVVRFRSDTAKNLPNAMIEMTSELSGEMNK